MSEHNARRGALEPGRLQRHLRDTLLEIAFWSPDHAMAARIADFRTDPVMKDPEFMATLRTQYRDRFKWWTGEEL